MRKELRMNLKKITALTLSAAMIFSVNMTVFAEEVTCTEEIAYTEEIIPSESEAVDDVEIIEEIESAEEEFTEKESQIEVEKVDLVEAISAEDEEARELESMLGQEAYAMKILTYLSLKYPDIDLDVNFKATGGDHTKDPTDNLYNLYNPTKMASQTAYDTIEIDGNDTFSGYPGLTKNMVQLNYLGNFGTNGGILQNDTVKTLIIKNVDEIRNLYVPASVESLTIENTTLNCYYYEKNSPGFQCDYPGDLKYCTNLKKLVLRNVKFGDNYKKQGPGEEANLLPEITGNCPYETNYTLHLQNCPNLEELEIDVSFEGAEEVQLAIDGGDNKFEKLTADKCKINPAPGTGCALISLYANENSNLAKFYSSTETVKFKNENFRRWLIMAIGIDTNHDGVVSQEELDAVETLTINDQTAHSIIQTSLSDFEELADIGQMHGLKTLEIDFYETDTINNNNANRHWLNGIDFPDSLENLTMKNVYWKKNTETKSHDNADIVLTNLKTLELYNTEVEVEVGDSHFNHHTQIKLTDTEGVLQSCIIESTDVESIELINNSKGKGIKDQDEKQRIRFSASDCQNLKTIEFSGEGYAVEGSLDLFNDKELTHIGVVSDNSVWTVYGELDSTYAPTNVILNSCAKLGSDCSKIVIDYDFINGRDINVQTMNTDFKTGNELIINRQPRIDSDRAGNVYLSCDAEGWIKDTYTGKDGFIIAERSSIPTIAVFANGQRIRTSGEGIHNNDSIYTEDSDRWVERYNLVMSPRGYSTDFGNLTFYVVDDVAGGSGKSLRRVFYKGKVYVEWEQQNDVDKIITLQTEIDPETGGYKLTGNKLSSTGKPGKVELKLYIYEKNSDGTFKTNADGSKVKSYIGYQDIKVYEMPDSVDLVDDGTKRGSGTKDDPFIVDKNKELKLKARLLVNDNVDRSGDYALRDVYWRIKEYDETPKYTSDSDGYSLYTLDTATKAGINVIRGKLNNGETEAQYDKRVDSDGSEPTYYNHRRFTFNTAGSKFKIVAQVPYKNNDVVISKEVFIEVRDPSEIPNETPNEKPNETPKPEKVVVSQENNISIEVAAKDSNGEALAIENLAGKVKVTDKKVIFAKAKEMPAIDGYTFKGWYQDGSKKKISSIPAKKYSSFADAKINAVYIENVYNIDYKMIKPQGVKGVTLNGKPVKQTKIKYTEKVKLSSEIIQAKTKEDKKTGTPGKNYKVAGWTTEKNSTTVMYKPGEEISKLAGKIKKDKKVILYPVWEEVK